MGAAAYRLSATLVGSWAVLRPAEPSANSRYFERIAVALGIGRERPLSRPVRQLGFDPLFKWSGEKAMGHRPRQVAEHDATMPLTRKPTAAPESSHSPSITPRVCEFIKTSQVATQRNVSEQTGIEGTFHNMS